MDFAQKRLTRELKLLQSDPPAGIVLETDSVACVTNWYVTSYFYFQFHLKTFIF